MIGLWDKSHWNDPGVGTALAEGIACITHKAGGDANDAELGDWWSRVKSLRGSILTGAYWVLYPGTPVARADAFIDRLDAVCAGWRDKEFFLFADCEKWNGNSSTVPPVSDVNAFCDRLVAKLPKLRPMAYLPGWVYGDSVKNCKYGVIESDYGSNASGAWKSLYPGDDSSRWNIGGGKKATILQYGSRATIGGQTNQDINAFKGTLQELKNLVSPGWNVAQKTYPRTPIIGNYTAPVLHYGDNDTDFGGYNGVGRAQELLNYCLGGTDLVVDGDYGDKTKAAVKEFMKGGDGKIIDLSVWLKLFGLSAK